MDCYWRFIGVTLQSKKDKTHSYEPLLDKLRLKKLGKKWFMNRIKAELNTLSRNKVNLHRIKSLKCKLYINIDGWVTKKKFVLRCHHKEGDGALAISWYLCVST